MIRAACEVDTTIILTTDEETGGLAIWSTCHLTAQENGGSEMDRGVATSAEPWTPHPMLNLLLL